MIKAVSNGFVIEGSSKVYKTESAAKGALTKAAKAAQRPAAAVSPPPASTPAPAVKTAPKSFSKPDWALADEVVRTAQAAARAARTCDGTKLFCGSCWSLGGFLRGSKVKALNPVAAAGFETLYKTARGAAEGKVVRDDAVRIAATIGTEIASLL